MQFAVRSALWRLFDIEACGLIGWSANTLASQPIRTRASKSDIFVFMLRWPIFLTASICIFVPDFLLFQRFLNIALCSCCNCFNCRKSSLDGKERRRLWLCAHCSRLCNHAYVLTYEYSRLWTHVWVLTVVYSR